MYFPDVLALPTSSLRQQQVNIIPNDWLVVSTCLCAGSITMRGNVILPCFLHTLIDDIANGENAPHLYNTRLH